MKICFSGTIMQNLEFSFILESSVFQVLRQSGFGAFGNVLNIGDRRSLNSWLITIRRILPTRILPLNSSTLLRIFITFLTTLINKTQWYDQSKVGIFVNFGVYSVSAFVSEWFWCLWKCPNRINKSVVKFTEKNYPPNFTYQDFANDSI